MFEHIRARLSFANIVSLTALFVALGGSAYAVTSLDRNSVESRNIVNNQVRGADVAEDTLGSVPASDTLGGALRAEVVEQSIDLDPSEEREFLMGCDGGNGLVVDVVSRGDDGSPVNFSWGLDAPSRALVRLENPSAEEPASTTVELTCISVTQTGT